MHTYQGVTGGTYLSIKGHQGTYLRGHQGTYLSRGHQGTYLSRGYQGIDILIKGLPRDRHTYQGVTKGHTYQGVTKGHTYQGALSGDILTKGVRVHYQGTYLLKGSGCIIRGHTY